MDEEIIRRISRPLDSDGFLRRQCPTCEREFKWRPDGDDDDGKEVPEAYFCPYCGVQAPIGDWFTEAQIARAEAIIMGEVVAPPLDTLGESLRSIGRGGGPDSASREPGTPEEAVEASVDDDDMRRVDHPCHPEEPLKVLEDWSSAVHCLICGATTAP